MAKSDNFFNITGKLGELIFCNRNGKTYVKQYSGGFTNKKTQNNPKVKDAQERFATVSRFIKSFKQELFPYLWRQKDGTFHNQLMTTFFNTFNKDPELSFNQTIQIESFYKGLKQKPLNNKSKIQLHSLTYNPTTNTLDLGNLPFLLVNQYNAMVLEVTMGWYSVIHEKPFLSDPIKHYVKLDKHKAHQKVNLDFAVKENPNALLPFL